MTNVPLAVGLATGEIAVLLGVTVRAFAAESRLKRDRGDDIRRANASRETLLLERIGKLIEDVRRVKSLLESFTDALFRSDWTDDVKAIGELGAALGEVQRAQQRVIARWRLLAGTMVVVHLAAPGFLLNNIVGKQLIPDALDAACAGVFAAATALAIVFAWLIRQADLSFERCLEAGIQ